MGFGARPFGTRTFGDSATPLYPPVSPPTIESGESWGTATVVHPGALEATPSAHPFGTRTFGGGTAEVPTGSTIFVQSTASAESFGAASVVAKGAVAKPVTLVGEATIAVKPTGIDSLESWGVPQFGDATTILLLAPVAESAEAWGVPTLNNTAGIARPVGLVGEVTIILAPSSIPSGESWGEPQFHDHTTILLSDFSIESTESWGSVVLHGVAAQARAITLFGETDTPVVNHILPPTVQPGGEVWGTPRVLPSDVIIIGFGEGSGVDSLEAWGLPQLNNFSGDTDNRTLDPNPNPLEPPNLCNDRYVRPVQIGSVIHLTVAISPAGRALFGWIDGNVFKVASRDNPIDIFTDNVVQAGDVHTAFTPSAGRSIHVASMFVEGGDLFAVVSDYIGDPLPNGRTRCLIADDPDYPTSWSERGVLQNVDVGAGDGGDLYLPDCRTGGVPTVLNTGRWVLPFHGWGRVIAAIANAIGLFTSDDRGVTWTVRILARKSPLHSLTAGPPSASVARDPRDGRLYFGSHIGPTGNDLTYSSGDNGSSWSATEEATAPHPRDFYIDDGVNMYATLLVGQERRIFRVGDPGARSTWTDLCYAVGKHNDVNEQYGFYSIPLFLGDEFWDVAFTAGDRIGAHARRNKWWVGMTGYAG